MQTEAKDQNSNSQQNGTTKALIPLELSFGDVTEKNIGQLRVLNVAIFPVRYNDKFYADLVDHIPLCTYAYHCDMLIGAVCCRVEPPKTLLPRQPDQPAPTLSQLASSTQTRLYIMTLGVLAPYRKLGIGQKLLDFALKICKDRPQIDSIYLHVQTSNQAAIDFYKRNGFQILETIENYYKKIDPPHCYVVYKNLRTPKVPV